MLKKLLISFFLILLVQLSFIKVADTTSSEHLDDALVRSLSVFAIARGLNGLISVVQGTEVYATPAGVGVNFAVGQIVDPMNDMLERFSWVMLMSSVSLGIQKLLLEFGQKELFQVLLGANALALMFVLWIPKLWHSKGFDLLFKFFVVLSFLRFLIPLVVLMNEGIYLYAFESKFVASEQALSYSQGEISKTIKKVQEVEEQTKMVAPRPKGLWDKTKEYFNDLGDSFNFQKYYQKLQDEIVQLLQSLKISFDEAIGNMLALIEIFILQSVILPLLSLWLFMKLFKVFMRMDIVAVLQLQDKRA